MKKKLAVVLGVAVLGCMLTEKMRAQGYCGNPAHQVHSTADIPSYYVEITPISPPPVGAVCLVCFGCCIPNGCMFVPGKPTPTPRCQSCSQRSGIPPQGGRPIDLATGNTFITQTDISLPGLGGGLTLTRMWNSKPSSVYSSGPHMFGLGWQSTYEDRLVYQTGDGFLTEESGTEDETAFGWTGASSGVSSYSVVGPANKVATVTQNVDSNSNTLNFTVVSLNGEKRVYDPNTGFLLSIADRNGNTTQLTYDTSNRLVTVTDPASRHLTFTYVSGTSSLVSTVTSDVGISLSYTYDTNGRLIKVTKPDNTIVTFTYDGHNYITSVLDNEGKVLESHTYDAAGHGLTSSRANGVDSVTVTYP